MTLDIHPDDLRLLGGISLSVVKRCGTKTKQ